MTAHPLRNRFRAQRGAILIHVAISAMVLLGFSAFVLDYGVMWLSRRQAQNAADAGALAGAVARAFDEPADPPPAGGKAFTSALTTAQANAVWNQTPVVNVDPTWACPGFVPGGGTTCVTVNVFRDRANGNPLPTLFAPLLGVTSQQVRATATARAVQANATDCMRPLAIPDNWFDFLAPVDKYDAWQLLGGALAPLPAPVDVLQSPGLSVGTDYGLEVTRTENSYQPVVVPHPGGPQPFDASLANCNGVPVSIGDSLEVDQSLTPADAGTQVGNWFAANIDGGAKWDTGLQMVTASCAPTCAPFSPRIIALPVFDPDEFQRESLLAQLSGGVWSSCPSGTACVHVRNIVGFFVSSMGGTGDHRVSGSLPWRFNQYQRGRQFGVHRYGEPRQVTLC